VGGEISATGQIVQQNAVEENNLEVEPVITQPQHTGEQTVMETPQGQELATLIRVHPNHNQRQVV